MPQRASFASLVAAVTSIGALGTPARALELAATVLDRDGAPVPHVVVYAVAEPAASAHPASDRRSPAVMGQHDSAFVPHILVVETGTRVEFPNTDAVSHHVYSFSPAKSFELPLYKGNVHAPLEFDEPGVVTLGCNIHDGMLGYILVVDTPHFGLTDTQGLARLDGLPPGDYFVHVWTPRMRAERLPEPQREAAAGVPDQLEFRFTSKLFPPHAHEGTSLSWRDY